MSDPAILALFAELGQTMSAGEAASPALARRQERAIGSDKERAFRRETVAGLGPGRIPATPGLSLTAIRSGPLSVEEAERAKAKLEALRLTMSFPGFRELLSQHPEAPKQGPE